RGHRRIRSGGTSRRPPAPYRAKPGSLRGHPSFGEGAGARARPAHGGSPARGGLRLGRDRPAEGSRDPRMIRWVVVLAGLAGCVSSHGPVGVIAPSADVVGTK